MTFDIDYEVRLREVLADHAAHGYPIAVYFVDDQSLISYSFEEAEAIVQGAAAFPEGRTLFMLIISGYNSMSPENQQRSDRISKALRPRRTPAQIA